jgi:phosphoribosylpyrophosphate synthetase
MPAGFFGTRADLLLDLVVASLVLVVPMLAYSWRQVRSGQYARHKLVQLSLFVVLGAAVLAFELHMRDLGGIFTATAASSYAGTATLNGWIYVHRICHCDGHRLDLVSRWRARLVSSAA